MFGKHRPRASSLVENAEQKQTLWHFHSCSRGGGPITRHNYMVDALYTICKSAGLGGGELQKEEQRSGDVRRPDIRLTPDSATGVEILVDVSYVNPQNAGLRKHTSKDSVNFDVSKHASGSTPGKYALKSRADSKRKSYESDVGEGSNKRVLPVIFDTYGAWGTGVNELIDIARGVKERKHGCDVADVFKSYSLNVLTRKEFCARGYNFLYRIATARRDSDIGEGDTYNPKTVNTYLNELIIALGGNVLNSTSHGKGCGPLLGVRGVCV